MPSSSLPQFLDYDEVYFADACEVLEQAVHTGHIELHAMVHGSYPGTALPDDVVSGVGSVGFWDAPRAQEWGLPWHRNEGIEITFVDRGELEFSTRTGEWTLKPGQFTITRPWQEHRVGRPTIGASRLHWIIVDVGVRRPHQDWVWPPWIGLATIDLSRLTAMLQNNENPVWPSDSWVTAAFESLRQIVHSPAASTLESELRLAIAQLFLAVLRALDREPALESTDTGLRLPQRAVRMFLEELNEHLDHQWTLGEMASAARLGRSQFTKYCRELTNQTPIEFLTSSRVALAMRLLRQAQHLSVTDIAMSAGFQSSQYFATVFRRHTGLSATAFRAQPTDDVSR